ncbi:LLM class flavin-dependent oxidoreductase [Rhodococcus wratislaviensis]|nr:LLM class flavin-dependent oxidoreductase [Rhodococcus wratislaviensis]
MKKNVRLILTLSEIWTMTDPRDLRRLLDMARIAEDAGVNALMVGEHPAMGPSADSKGRTLNPRDFLMAYNQPPDTPFPAHLPLLAAMAAVTSRIRLIAGATLAPLRHPLLIAKELGTVDLLSQGRLVVVPTVSWQPEEYGALGVDFSQRGKLLDEHLEIWTRLWNDGSPVSFEGANYGFKDIYIEPAPYRPGGPPIWTGGKFFSPWMVRRVVAYGKGLYPIVPPTDDQMADLAEAMRAVGRDISELELVANIPPPPFTDADGLLDLDAAIANAPELVERGYTTLLLKPSMFIDDVAEFEEFCRSALSKLVRAVNE